MNSYRRHSALASMKRIGLRLGLTSAAGIAVGMIGIQILNAQEPMKEKVLLQSELAGIEGKEGTVSIHPDLAPGASSGKHYHPGDQFVYILEGSGTLEVEGESPAALKQGSTFYLTPKQVHEVKNASKTAPLKGLAILVAEKGQPPLVPVK